jgi:hypothetical protein
LIIFCFLYGLVTNLYSQIISLRFQKKQFLIDIITSIEFIQWNKAKSIWILHFLFDNYSIDCDCDDCISVFLQTKTNSTYGSEYEFLLEPIIQIKNTIALNFVHTTVV